MATEIMSPSRKIKAKVEFYKNSTLAATYSGDDNIIEVVIEQTGEQGKFFGFGICQSATVKLLDPNRTIDINQYDYFLVYFTVNSLPYGATTLPRFYPKEITRDEKTNNLTIKGYDMLYDAANHTWNDLNVQPQDLGKAVAAIATYLKATKFQNSSNNGFSIAPPYNLEGTETLRSVLDDAAEATTTYYYCDGANQLVFTDILQTTTPYSISKEDYFTLKADNQRQLANITYATELGDNVTATNGGVGDTQYIRDNNILGLKPSSEVATILKGYIDALANKVITPYECTWRGNYQLAIGTPLAIVAKDNSTINTYLFNQTLTYNGGLNSKLSWTYKDTSESESNPATLGEVLNKTYAKVDKQEKRITLLASNVSSQTEAIKKTVKQVDVEYYLSTSTTQLTGGTWATVAPTWENGKYMWSRQKVTYTDGTTAIRNATCIAGAKGAKGAKGKNGKNGTDGKDGADGRGISSVTTEYYISTSDTALQGGSWTTTQPEWAEGTYIWTRTKIVYTNPEEVTYTTPLYDAYWVAVNSIAGQQKVNTTDIANLTVEKNNISASVQKITETQTALSQTVNDVQSNLSDSQNTTATQIDTLTKRVDAAMTAEQVELIVQEEMAGGVNKVTTSTGFTFNQEGLTIKKSDVDITTNISEDGMRVSKGGEVVLTADNSGVQARNLHATTYLIIGENSRFEDYNNGSRTGCFWIGG